MKVVTKEQVEQTRADIAKTCGLSRVDDVRCLYCGLWGYNRGKAMNSMGESRCAVRKWPDAKTASYQWCKKFANCRVDGK
jgi:hypothetical protein